MDEHKLGQLLLTGVPGKELDSETAARLKQLQPGGFILFGRNIESPEQLRKLVDDLRDLSDTEPFITIDQEGGRVSRLRLIGSEPPSAQELREKGDPGLIKRHGKLTGEVLRSFGFNLDLCPVLDVSDGAGDLENSLKGRTYGLDIPEVISNAGVFNAAMRKAGVLSCGKHFPSYTTADTDPHHELSVCKRTKDELLQSEIIPYTTLMPELDTIMSCHTCYLGLEPDNERVPASLSENVINQFLRNQLGFDGLVMTDDLDMGAILNEVGFEETIIRAIKAGNDMAMICHRVEMVEEAKKHLEKVPEAVINTALERIDKTKRKLSHPFPWSIDTFRDIDKKIWDLRVDTLGEEKAREQTPEDGKRSPVELY